MIAPPDNYPHGLIVPDSPGRLNTGHHTDGQVRPGGGLMAGGANYSYPDKLGYGETVMFHLRRMSSEMAADGLDNEFEDLVDMLDGWCGPTWT